MKYLKKYQNKSEYDADYYSGKLPFPHVALVEGNVVYAEQFESETDERTPLYIEALEDLTVKFSVNAIQYSLDNSSWEDLPADTPTPNVSAGSKIYFRAKELTASSASGIGTFTISGMCNLGGNIMSMQDGADFIDSKLITASYSFCKLFYAQTKIINAKRLILPAITLADYCYYLMFYGCSSLVEAPELPAKSLWRYCYSHMFDRCSSLVKAPELPATTAASSCYYYMFYGCSSLVEAPAIPLTAISDYCCSYMFYGCSSLIKASAPPARALIFGNSCYAYMFANCTSLVEAPELPAIELSSANECYAHMFENCVSLVKAPELPIKVLTASCYTHMFANCVSLVKAPELPAQRLIQGCYTSMFHGCSSLEYIKTMLLDSPSSGSCSSWVYGVSGVGTFVKNRAATWESTFGSSAIPTGWKVQLADA